MRRHHGLRCAGALLLALVAAAAVPGQAPQTAPSLHYTLAFPQPHTHLYEVTLAVGNVTGAELDLALPTWTPGSYLQREFARHVQDFEARDGAGRALRWEKADKATWRVSTGGAGAVRASYRVYANELSVRTSHLDASHAYFNGASVFMYVKGALDRPLTLRIVHPAGWHVTTPLGLAPDADGFYHAPNYDILVDSPTEVGSHRLLEFAVRGKTHRVAIWGEADYDERRLKEDLGRIVEQGALVFGGLPYDHYTFIVHLQPGSGGGLEHLNSTTLQASPRAFRPRRNYVRFLSLAAHEFFHVWNVKRIRPQALGPFDYQAENYTRALWVSEGITDYYGSLLLRRAGLVTMKEYLADLAGEILTYEQTPGREEQSAEASSFDAWIKHYRPDENSANTSISYYNKGALLGWMLDFEIRRRTHGARTLDDVMRHLDAAYAQRGVGFPEGELRGVFEKVAGADLTDFFRRYVSGTEKIDFDAYLQAAGLRLERRYQPNPLLDAEPEKGERPRPGALGVRTRTSGERVIVSVVLAGAPAYEAGVNAGDELVALDGQRVDASNYADRTGALLAGQRVTLTLFRRERLVTLSLTAGVKPPDRYVITRLKEANAAQQALLKGWVGEEEKAADAER